MEERSVFDELKDQNFKFNKQFGQNFISDSNLLKAIVNDADVEGFDVLEIGTGAGTLTSEIGKKAKKVVSYEIDKNLIPYLENKFASQQNITIVNTDALKTPIKEIENDFDGEYKIVANLPYYITTPLIFKFLEESHNVKSLTLMVQKEVAEKMIATEKQGEYGVLSVMIAHYATPKIMRTVKRQMFRPMPNVDSAIIKLEINKKKYDENYNKKYHEFILQCFQMRRKKLFNNLKKYLENNEKNKEKIINLLYFYKKDENVRAEELSPEAFVQLFETLEKV